MGAGDACLVIVRGVISQSGATMATATPDTFLQVLEQVFNDALDDADNAAKDGPDRFKDLLEEQSEVGQQALHQVKQLPAEAIEKLKELLDPPDWWSLLVYSMTRVAELDDRLSLGVVDIPGWERMLTLTFTPGVEGIALTVGLALVHPKPQPGAPDPPPKTRGLMLRGGQAVGQAFSAGAFSLSVTSSGHGTWFIPFRGGISMPDVDTATMTIEVTVDFLHGKNLLEGAGDVGELVIGPFSLTIILSKDTLYDLTLGIGTATTAGLKASLKPPEVLRETPLSIQLPSVAYHPSAHLTSVGDPSFTLGQDNGNG